MQYVKPATESEPQIGIVVKTDPLLGVANFFTVNRAGGGATLMKCVPFDQLTSIPAVKYVEGRERGIKFMSNVSIRFNPSSFVLTPEILGYLKPLFTGATKYDDDDVVTISFDDDNEPDLELCEALRSRSVVSEGIHH